MNEVIICGDCREEIKKINDSSVDLIIADPPYLTTKQTWDREEVFKEDLVRELHRVLKSSGNIYVWCGIGEKSQSLIRWFPLLEKYFAFKDLITWKKQRGLGARKGWLYTREEILWFVKDKKQFKWNAEEQYSTERRSRDKGKDSIKPSQNGYKAKSLYKRITNVWTDISEESFNVQKVNTHYTPKPKKAIERIIRCHTQEGDLVLDPFGGSGITALVSKELKRNYIIMEKDAELCLQIENKLRESS